MMFGRNLPFDDRGIYYIQYYHPYRRYGCLNSSFDDYSSRILDLKNNRQEAITFFAEQLCRILPDNPNIAITCVPSHTAYSHTANHEVIKLICSQRDVINASSCLERFITIPKLSTGGTRDARVHYDSIRLVNPEVLDNRDILIIDDVTTTGNSIITCKRIIHMNVSRYKSINCLVYGKTV